MKLTAKKFVVIIKSFFKWVLLLCLGFVIVFFGYAYYTWWNFDTKTLPENYGKVSSQLYLGKGENQPLVVILGGSSGGNQWAQESFSNTRELFEKQGLATLAVGYFGMEGIPKTLDRVGIEGVHQAILDAANNPKINKNCIGIMGISRGSVLALLLGSKYEEYKCVAAVVPGNCVFFAITEVMNTSAYAHNKIPLPFVPMRWAALPSFASGKYLEGFELIMKDTVSVQKASIPVEDIEGSILFMSAKNDEVWPSMKMSETMMQRLEKNNFRYSYQHISLEGGHEEFVHHFSTLASFFSDKLNRCE